MGGNETQKKVFLSLMAGDPFGVRRDPEMWAAAIASAYTAYRSATSDPDATLRFTEARDEWLKVLDAFVKYDGISAFMRYYQITDWLYAERKRLALRPDDESAVTERLLGLLQHLYEPEADALEVAIESLKKKHAATSA
jgi:hypothetical protein